MKRPGSKKPVGDFLKARVDEIVTSGRIQEVVPGVAEWARRVRDLRAEGWRISSHNDRANLKPGQYILEDEPPEPGTHEFTTGISARLRAEILERNGYTCQMCGIGAGEETDDGRPARMHIGHIQDRDHGGSDEPSNLRVLCSTCNQGAKNLVQEPPGSTWLIAQVRRAPLDYQRDVYEWLKRKFESD